MFGYKRRQQEIQAQKDRDNFKGVKFTITPKVYQHTPDVALLQQKVEHLYFAYHLVNNSHSGYIDSGITADPFQLWKGQYRDGVHPFAMQQIPEMRRFPCLPIKGRLLLLSTEELIQLDEGVRNGVQFTRKKVVIRIPREFDTHERDATIRMGDGIFPAYSRRNSRVCVPLGGTVKAQIHIGRPEFFAEQLDGGYKFSPVKPFDEFNPKYLQFTVRDFDHG